MGGIFGVKKELLFEKKKQKTFISLSLRRSSIAALFLNAAGQN